MTNHVAVCLLTGPTFFAKMDLVSAQWTHTPSHLSQMQAGKISKGRKEVQPKADPAGSAALSLLSSLVAQGGVAGLSGLEAQTLANISLLQQLQTPQSTEGAPAASVGGAVGGT